MFALLGGWLYVLLFGAGWFLGAHALGAGLYLVLFFALNMILSAVLRSWLMRSGTDILRVCKFIIQLHIELFQKGIS